MTAESLGRKLLKKTKGLQLKSSKEALFKSFQLQVASTEISQECCSLCLISLISDEYVVRLGGGSRTVEGMFKASI